MDVDKPVELENYDEDLNTEENSTFGYQKKDVEIHDDEDIRQERQQAFSD